MRMAWLAFTLVLSAALATIAPAATITVYSLADANSSSPPHHGCTLREAVLSANTNTSVGPCVAGDPGADVIVLSAGTYDLSIGGPGEDAGETGDLDVRESVEIAGVDSSTTIIDAHSLDRILDVPVGEVALTIHDVTLLHGSASDPVVPGGAAVRMAGELVAGPFGAGFWCPACTLVLEDAVLPNMSMPVVVTGGALATIRRARFTASQDWALLGALAGVTVEDSTFADTVGTTAIWQVGGLLTLRRSTVSNTAAPGGLDGSAVRVESPSSLPVLGGADIENSTLTGNVGLTVDTLFSGHANVRSSTLVAAGPDHALCGPGVLATNSILVGQCGGSVTSAGGNVESPGNTCGLTASNDQPNVADPKLGPLAANGGPTLTHALLTGSPAIGHGLDTDCPATDQRGVARPAPQGGHCDVGAYEYNTGCGASLSVAGLAPVALAVRGRRRRARA
ncbi:MAG: hypothetical protein IPK07_21705 [Deltaproteobacteria bacterium]|nr:hypothetical protein [Deltaproteobacteria bacterium]